MSKAPFRVPNYSFKQLARVAEDFLTTHHSDRSLPIPIEEIIEFDLGLDIVPVPGLLDLDVDGFITADLKEIRVDKYIQEKVSTRYRASLAHEISHFLIHSDLYKQLSFSTTSEWKAVLASLPGREVDRMEDQARLLGALILVPPEQLRQQFDLAAEKVRGSLNLDQLSDQGRQLFAGGIAKPFEVSPALMLRRLRQDRLL